MMNEYKMRDTKAVRQRIENVKALLNKLADTPMDARQIADFLKFTPSGVRKYVRELRDFELIAIEIDSPENRPIYYLCATPQRLEKFIKNMDNIKKPYVFPKKESAGRVTHTTHEDGIVRAKKWKIPEPDPVLAHFFGFFGFAGK